jgi:hypothetical protein
MDGNNSKAIVDIQINTDGTAWFKPRQHNPLNP